MDIDKGTFTGSNLSDETRSRPQHPLTSKRRLELGGKVPNIISDDVTIDDIAA